MNRGLNTKGMSLIIGLFTDLGSPGGVQRAGRHVAAVTAKYAAEHGLSYRFLSLNDPQGLHTLRVGSNEFSFSGHARDKAQFTLAALRAAGRKPLLATAMHANLGPILWAMKIRSPKMRLVVFTHGIEVWKPLSPFRRFALRRSDLVAGPSTDTIRHVTLTQGVRPEKVLRLPWGLDPEFEERLAAGNLPAFPADFPSGRKVILTIGRWDPAEQYKGADTLISAMPAILETATDAFLVLIGEGADQPRLEQLARDAGVAASTRFIGPVTKDELFAWYFSCDLFALPSRGEGFGLVFLEAMALGKPVIGGAHGGIPDVIEEGRTGLLVPHGDVERLRSAVCTLLMAPASAAKMGANGRERVKREFSFSEFQRRLAQAFDDVLLCK